MQFRLMPLLATTYAMHFISGRVFAELREMQQAQEMDFDRMKDFHVLISGLKALGSWHCRETLLTVREAMGGMGSPFMPFMLLIVHVA